MLQWRERGALAAMFEGWLAGVLQDKLGKYLDISRADLRMGLWKGSIVLRNIELKELSIPNLPLCLRGGRLGRLEISIPWKNLKTRPVVVTMSQLLVVLAARGATTDGERAREAERSVAEKRKALANEEALLGSLGALALTGSGGDAGGDEDDEPLPLGRTQSRPSTKAAGGAGEEGGGTFKERLLASIVANLSVQVHSVRIVYEDELSLPGRCGNPSVSQLWRCADLGFCAGRRSTISWGMVLHSFELDSCSEDGAPLVVDVAKVRPVRCLCAGCSVRPAAHLSVERLRNRGSS